MSRSFRVLTVLVVVECGLAILWWWLLDGLRSGRLNATGGNVAEATATISSTLGGAMGVIAGMMLVTAFVVRRRAA